MKVGNAEVQLVLDKARFMRALTLVKMKVKAFAMKAQMQMHRLGAVVSGVASKFKLLLVAGIAAAGVAIWKAVSTFAKFESQMASIGTMLDETSKKYLPSYAKGMRGLSIEVGESTETLSKGLYNILSATIPANQAMEVLELAAKGAAGGMTTTDVAVTALTKAMLQYKDLAPEKIMDTLAAAVERGYFTFEQLAGAMPGVLQLGKSSNITFGELSGTMAFLSKRFATVNEAGTALEGLLKAIKIPTGRYKDALDAMGITAKDVQDRIGKEGLQGGLKWMIDKAESVGLSVDTMFRRKEAMLAITAMSTGMKDWKVDIDKVSDSAGTMQRKYKEMQETLTFQTNRLKQGFTDAFRVMGTQLAPVVKDLVDDLIQRLPSIIDFGKKIGIELAGWYYWITTSAKSGALKYIWEALGYVYKKVKDVFFNFKALGIYLTGEFAIAMKKQSIASMEAAQKNMLVDREVRESLKERVKEAKKELSELRDKQIADLGKVQTKHEEFLAFFKESEESKKTSAKGLYDFVSGLRDQDDAKDVASLGAKKISFDAYMLHLRETKKTGFEKDQELLNETLTLKQKFLLKMFRQEKSAIDYIMDAYNNMVSGLTGAFEIAINSIIAEGISFKNAMKGFFDAILKTFLGMIAQIIAKWLIAIMLKNIFTKGIAGLVVGATLIGAAMAVAERLSPAVKETAETAETIVTAVAKPKELMGTPEQLAAGRVAMATPEFEEMMEEWKQTQIRKFQKGINYVPFDMLAMVHKGEKIIPANKNQPQNYNMGGITLNLSVGSMSQKDVEPIARQLVEAIKNKLPGAMSLSKHLYTAGGELTGEA